MKLDSKGITIVELMLGIVLFSIVALSITFFISTGTTTCNYAEAAVTLQEEAQVVTNQLISFSQNGNCVKISENPLNGDVRYVVYGETKDSVGPIESVIYYKKSSEELYYYEVSNLTDNAAIRNEIMGTANVSIGQLMGEYIKDFKVTDKDNWITFQVTYGNESKTIKTEESIKLRNRRVEVESPFISLT